MCWHLVTEFYIIYRNRMWTQLARIKDLTGLLDCDNIYTPMFHMEDVQILKRLIIMTF